MTCPTGLPGYQQMEAYVTRKRLIRQRGGRWVASGCPLCHDWHVAPEPKRTPA